MATQDLLADVSASGLRRIDDSLVTLLDDGRLGSIMVTGNNRFPAWDVRHAYDDPAAITNVDHLEIYRGYDTHEHVGAGPFIRALARRQLTKRGLRIS